VKGKSNLFKNIFSKGFLFGIIFGTSLTLLLGLVLFCLFVWYLPAWKSNWLLTTTRLLFIENKLNLQSPQIIYSSPSSWNFLQSESSPKIYNLTRDLGYYSNQNKSFGYTQQLEILAGSEEASIQRGEFLKNWLHEIKSMKVKDRQKWLEQLIGYQIGYIPDVLPSYSGAEKTETIIKITGRYGAKFHSLILNIDDPKGIVIALHGRGGTPEAVVGKINDYANRFGEFWHKAGYTVIAPDLSNNDGLNFPRLGLSANGADIALLLDLIEYIKNQYGERIPIIISGISYGSFLAEMIGLLSVDVDAVVSIGGASRYDYNYSMYSLPSKTPLFQHYLNSFLDNGGVYDLILPKKLIISVGNYDAGNWGRNGSNKIFLLNSFVERNIDEKSNYRINLFRGAHEADPINEIKLYEELVDLEN